MLPIKIDLPEGFLDEEERCGYLVSSKMKKLWAVELDLLAEFIRVCKKYDLKYYALGGTLLGAVRHKGFIPWDDDIDVIMPRDDYDKLISISDKVFNWPYFLSSPLSEYSFWRGHLQLRNSSTTAVTKFDEKLNNNKGIFIDIMPLDTVPKSDIERNKHRKKIKNLSIWFRRKNKYINNKTFFNTVKYLITSLITLKNDPADLFNRYNNELKKFKNLNTGYVAHAALSYNERGVWPLEWFDAIDFLDFEFIKIQVPGKYNLILNKYFGTDFMQIPKRFPPSSHGTLFFNTDEPFTNKYKWEAKT